MSLPEDASPTGPLFAAIGFNPSFCYETGLRVLAYA